MDGYSFSFNLDSPRRCADRFVLGYGAMLFLAELKLYCNLHIDAYDTSYDVVLHELQRHASAVAERHRRTYVMARL